MNKNRFNTRVALLPAALIALLSGCATTPPPEPVTEQAVQPLVATPATEPAPHRRPVEEVVAAVRPDHPERYVVQPGDTLWDISARFLRDPWYWPEIWSVNPQVRNPHLIYPGDILSLVYIDGRPTIQVQRGGDIRLSPQIRVEDLDRAVPTIPIDAIRQFLGRHRVVGAGELELAPYILSSTEQRLIAGSGDTIFVRGIEEPTRAWQIVRSGKVYRNPDDPKDILGYEALDVGDARLEAAGDPATLQITRSTREVLVGDRLMPEADDRFMENFIPRGPEQPVSGRILAVIDGVNQIGQHQIIALGVGADAGLEPGHVLAVWQDGGMVRDPINREQVKLPDQRAGVVMVFRVFDRMSYALVMNATRAMHVRDVVTNP